MQLASSSNQQQAATNCQTAADTVAAVAQWLVGRSTGKWVDSTPKLVKHNLQILQSCVGGVGDRSGSGNSR